MDAGTRLGPYEIVARLGAGGMGEVYRAVDTRLGRTVAVKVIRSAEGVDADQRRRFRREAEIASRLTHPHICTLFDVGAEGELDYLVLEHLEGETLAERLARGPLALDQALRVAGEIADALAFAHSQGFVHRDLKPGNVFLTPAGAKLLDFGLARASPAVQQADSGAQTAEAPLTEAGVLCGTPPYMSPEQASGRPLDERSDEFSFGSLLFEMLTGQRAFRGTSTVETLSAVLRDDPLARGEARKLPPPIAGVLARLLAKEPADRYALMGEVVIALRGARSPAGSGTPLMGSAAPVHRRPAAIAAIVAATVLLAGAAFLWRARSARTAIDSVAVLPFSSAGTDAEAALLADGMTESLINGLAELPTLRMMALSSVAAYRGKEVDPRQVGRALGVRAVLTGRLMPRGGAIAVSAALADAVDGRHLWGASYEKEAADVLALQSQLARDLGLELRRRLTGEQRDRLARPATEDREAYLLHQKGRYAAGLRTREGLLRSIDLYRQALEKDAGYARAWAGLAESYDVLTYSHYLPPTEGFGKAREAVKKALELDPALADAWAVLAHVTMLEKGDHAAAETSFRKALALNPSCANAHHWYSHLLIETRRFDESLRESQAALEVDPLSMVMSLHLGEHHFLTGNVEPAVEQLRKTIEMDPRFGLAHYFLGLVEASRGHATSAVAELEEAVRLMPDSADALSRLGALYAEGGRRADAEQIAARLEATARERYVSPYARAVVYASLHDEPRTLEALQRAMEVGEQRAMARGGTDPLFAFLRENPRYQALQRSLTR